MEGCATVRAMMRPVLSAALLALSTLTVIACGPPPGDEGTPKPLTLPPPQAVPTTPAKTAVGRAFGPATSITVGADGGTLVTPDEGLTVIIPAGAAPAGTVITATPITNHVPGGFGPAYRLTKPDGVTFAQPVTVRFAYASADLEGRPLSGLHIARQRPDTTWEAFVPTVDAANKTLSVTTTGFSDWANMSGWQLVPGSSQVRAGHSKNLLIKSCDLKEYDDGMGGTITSLSVYDCTNSRAPSAVGSWAVNGVAGGNPTLGKISNVETHGATFTAPEEVPTPETVEVSVEMTTGRAKEILIARVRITKTLGYLGTVRLTAIARGGSAIEATTLQARAEVLFLRTSDDATSANYDLEAADSRIDVLTWGFEGLSESCKPRGNATVSPSLKEGLYGAMGITKDPKTYSFNGTVSLSVPARCRSRSTGTETTRDFDGLAFIFGTDTTTSFQEQPLPDPLYFEERGFSLQVGQLSVVQDWSFARSFQ